METKTLKTEKSIKKLILLFGFVISFLIPQSLFAHCDSYDGPVIQDALKALDQNKVALVMKWIDEKHEPEIEKLFKKTIKYKKLDQEVYQLLEKHFLETLVRVHREGEGEPYTGLKPAGSTSEIIQLTDTALREDDIESFLQELNGHTGKVVREKYEKVGALKPVKDNSIAQGRAYVAAYVDYTHTIEALHAILEHSANSHIEKH